ncbi:hypothetical protein V6N13_125882 [Hibiscus sabdariffa]|uniref:Uncharacterized protein n=1 Tax=Hibiscus sabdariffa TaxID=183260 RepID=A0ABR2NXG3_9ROSI
MNQSNSLSLNLLAQMMSAKIDSLEIEIGKERAFSSQIAVKCQELEEELSRKQQEAELQKIANSNVEPKIKHEDLAVATGKLAECQKTIASLEDIQSLQELVLFVMVNQYIRMGTNHHPPPHLHRLCLRIMAVQRRTDMDLPRF